MKRKTENGCEIQNSADGWAWEMLCHKLVKTVEDENACLADLGSDGACLTHGTQEALCLLQDSYFSSVSTLDALNANGMKHIGVTKNATRKFPAAYLDNCELNERGDARHLERLDDYGQTDLLPIVWVDRDYNKFVSNAEGVEDHAEPIVCKRWCQLEKNVYADTECVTLTIPHPKVVQTYYDTCGEIDHHNCQHQDDLELEHIVCTVH